MPIQTHWLLPPSHTGRNCICGSCAHHGGGGGGGMSAGANSGAYAGGGVHHAGGGGGGLHSLVHTLRDQFGSHCAQLTPGVAAITAAIGNNATATLAARRRTNLVT
jgi:hypothetical protein